MGGKLAPEQREANFAMGSQSRLSKGYSGKWKKPVQFRAIWKIKSMKLGIFLT